VETDLVAGGIGAAERVCPVVVQDDIGADHKEGGFDRTILEMGEEVVGIAEGTVIVAK
jgi:hypothetical protein